MRLLLSSVLIFVSFGCAAQFAPPAGQPGSTAVHRDSSAIVAWATGCTVTRGYRDISRPDSGYVTAGKDSLGTEKSDGATISLGDGGSAILTFPNPIVNGPGDDFAVFENSFDGLFLEFGFVEVSSDGINYFRFPAISNVQDTLQAGTFANTDTRFINNLAGKYKVFNGTPFDLDELKDSIGLDVDHITHVRVIDVVGCIQDAYANYDINGNKINDPWKTFFAVGGFDLDGVAVIHQDVSGIGTRIVSKFNLNVFPNPANAGSLISFECGKPEMVKITVIDLQGREVGAILNGLSATGVNHISFNTSGLSNGIYFLNLNTGDSTEIKKIVIANE